MGEHEEKCPEGKKWPQQQGRRQLTLVIPLRETSSEPRMSMHRARRAPSSWVSQAKRPPATCKAELAKAPLLSAPD